MQRDELVILLGLKEDLLRFLRRGTGVEQKPQRLQLTQADGRPERRVQFVIREELVVQGHRHGQAFRVDPVDYAAEQVVRGHGQ